jgi:hypothetical protein
LKKSAFDRRWALLMSVVLWALSTPVHGWQQPAAASSLVTRNEREAFLGTARFATDPPTDGRTSWRAVLDDGTRKHDASVVTDDGSGPTRRSYRFNVAAYELDKLLGLNLVPATVERSVNGRPAAVTWWIDDVAMTEVDRRRKRVDPPDQGGWDRQMHAVRVFDELISNTYRDTAPALYLNSVWDNLLITTDWTIWITDHTGGFRTRQVLQDPETLVRCPRSVLGRLRDLNRPRLQQTLERYLSSQQLDALEVRRTLLVKHFDGEIESRGEGVVLYDLPARR